MTFVGVVGILLGLAAVFVAFVKTSNFKLAMFGLLYIVHVITTFAYYLYSQSSISDSQMYYNDPFGNYADGFGFSTQFIIFTVQASREFFGGTYLDYFLVFQAFGFFGLAFLMRIFEEIYAELGLDQPAYTYLLLFLPGFHFWTSSIGKDGLLFAAVCLTIWATMSLRQRYVGFGIGMLIMLIVRPHIALIGMAALAITVFFDRRTRFRVRIVLLVIALLGAGLALTTVESTFSVDLSSADSVSDFFASREGITQDVDAGNTVVDAIYPVRLLSLLFRPLFFDAEGVFAYIASFESFMVLAICGFILIHFRRAGSLATSITFARYALIFALLSAVLLALIYYNVGLGLRQRIMILPGIIVLFVTLRATRAFAPQATQGGSA